MPLAYYKFVSPGKDNTCSGALLFVAISLISSLFFKPGTKTPLAPLSTKALALSIVSNRGFFL